jgi:protein-disulfide isomerase
MGSTCPGPVLRACLRRPPRHGFGYFCCGLAIILPLASSLRAADDGCRAITEELSSHVTQYLAHRIVSEAGGVPSILSADRVPGTCYQKLVIHVPGTANPLTLYLSPDQRFLTSTLYDLATDPSEERARVAEDVQRLLMRDDSPQLSGTHPRVVIVEFGDLQCPYCKRFADWYGSLPAELAQQTTLVFKHFPLATHSWAQLAAQYSACANRRSAAAFWELANYFLSHQDEITSANIKDKAAGALSHGSDADARNLASCAEELGPSLVARDVSVAKELAVNRTPTLYIDGRQAPPLHSEGDLRHLLERELQDRPSHAATAGK